MKFIVNRKAKGTVLISTEDYVVEEYSDNMLAITLNSHVYYLPGTRESVPSIFSSSFVNIHDKLEDATCMNANTADELWYTAEGLAYIYKNATPEGIKNLQTLVPVIFYQGLRDVAEDSSLFDWFKESFDLKLTKDLLVQCLGETFNVFVNEIATRANLKMLFK